MKNASCLTLDEAWYEACGTLHSTVLILLMLPISSDGWQAQVCQGRCGEGSKRGLLTRAIKYEIFKSPPKAGWCMGAWQARIRSSCQKLWRKQRRNKGEWGKGGRGGGELQVALKRGYGVAN